MYPKRPRKPAISYQRDTACAPQYEHQPCKPLHRPWQNAMPDTHLGAQACSPACLNGCGMHDAIRGIMPVLNPDTGKRRPGVACRHPDADQAVRLADREKDGVVHGSSLCGPCRRDRIQRHGARNRTATRSIGSGGGESGFGGWLTRSNHRSYDVTSGERIVCRRTRGDCLSAHRNTGRISKYSEVLVRILCS